MRSKLWVAGLLVLALVITACGSKKSSSSSSSASNTSTPSGKKTTGVPSRTYRLVVTGKAETPPGPASGKGNAVISLHGKTNQVCWRFSHLHGVVSPTFAHIHLAPKGKSGNIVVPLSTGPHFKTKGCVPASATLIKAIAANPKNYYVNIHSKKYPAGAVRSQL